MSESGAKVITIDTSALYGLLDRLNRDYVRAKTALLEDPGPYLIPVAILSEIAHLTERRLGIDVLVSLLDDVTSGGYALDCGERDMKRVKELVLRYRDLPLGLADATVVACAERNGGSVLTFDSRHFGVVARDARIRVLPA
ncbi:MAG: type II toxin-antitoxin system VapC family toxin [Armatimonadota bacterium]